jgi:putative transposase
MNKTFGCCRQIYNLHLNERNEYWKQYSEVPKEERPVLTPTTEKQWKEKFEYMKEVSSTALQQSRKDCDQAFDNWFKSSKGMIGGKFKHPRFKSKKSNNFSYREVMISENCFDFDHRTLNIPKLKKVKFKLRSLPKNFIIKSVKNITVKKTPSGKYFASLCCEVEYTESRYRHESQMSAIGLDWSPKTMFVTDDGKTGCDYNYVAFKQKSAKKLHMLQKRMMKKQKDGKNRNKARIKVARLEEHIANQRKDFQEKLALELVKQHQVIGLEDLDLNGISKFLRNAKNINDTGWRNFVSTLEKKAPRFNSVVIKADKWFASSKICSKCGHVKRDLKLSDRSWTCPECRTSHIRDVNAAINLKNNALSTLGSGGIQACGDSRQCLNISQTTSTKQERLAVRPSKNGNHLQ